MNSVFEAFMLPLKDTHFRLKDYVDFPKVAGNVDEIAIKLNALNYLIGQPNMDTAVQNLWKQFPEAFSVLEILIAVRADDHKKAVNSDGETQLISEYLKSPEGITEFLNETGLTHVFQTKQIKNLVDYVFGVEVGLDTNARKNRGGHLMENILAEIFTAHGIEYRKEVYYSEYPEIVQALGADKKRFDFVVSNRQTTFLVEANFYSGGGSKLNEVARAYSELSPKINSVNGFEFVWITDGVGWNSARNKLEEAFAHIPNIYNLSNIHEFIDRLKTDL